MSERNFRLADREDALAAWQAFLSASPNYQPKADRIVLLVPAKQSKPDHPKGAA